MTEENLRELVKLVNEEMDSTAQVYRKQMDIVLAEIADVNRRLGRLYDAIETGKISLEDLAPRIKELKARKDGLEARRWELEWQLKDRKVELADVETVACYVKDLRDLLSESSLAERKAFIRSFVKEVKVTNDEVFITYTIPMPSRGTTEEGISVPSIVQNGGPVWTVPELFFEKKQLIPALQQLLLSYPQPAT